MLLATHFAVGIAIGRRSPTPGLAFILGLISHFLLDRTPHWDGIRIAAFGNIRWKDQYNFISAVIPDVAITAIIALYAIQQRWLPWLDVTDKTFWGVFGAIFPDLLWIPYHILGIRRPRHFFEFHKHIQRKAQKLPSILFQIALVLFSLFLAR